MIATPFLVKAMTEKKTPKPYEDQAKITIYVKPNVKQALTAYAKLEDRSVSYVIGKAIEKLLEDSDFPLGD